MIDISGENSCHIELVTLKVTMCHLYPPKGDYSFEHVIFKNTLKKAISDICNWILILTAAVMMITAAKPHKIELTQIHLERNLTFFLQFTTSQV